MQWELIMLLYDYTTTAHGLNILKYIFKICILKVRVRQVIVGRRVLLVRVACVCFANVSI